MVYRWRVPVVREFIFVPESFVVRPPFATVA